MPHLGKEIQLKHRAPVIGVSIIDGANNAVEPDSKPTDTVPPHRVIICSEEQIKVSCMTDYYVNAIILYTGFYSRYWHSEFLYTYFFV